ncbi:11S globulin seed storage protein 1-like [Impatiens glandulifera]|uniref:11S globulin seed storage protein 1-like n=1 Tax=Impatiens glandulifera TaxID=253017 RepID=UPI001FB0DB38|nr:11S globulin seed storage protein 1-like [Impatiens glandulifera]XP_047326804.1 11S globulin seed storage protein 1-like [Impatiens glandulifera]
MNTSLLSLSFLLIIFLGTVSARSRGQSEHGFSQEDQAQCQLQRLNAQEPTFRIQAEAGESQIWDWKDDQFRCAGVVAARHTINPRGLFLPSYSNAPLLMYIVKGNGMSGVLMPGCPETFQSSQESQQQDDEKSTRFHDQHQKIRRFRQGDVIAIGAGWTHWCYNDGNEDVVAIVVEDTGNNLNQLDQNPRKFFLAGNPQQGFGGAEQQGREKYYQAHQKGEKQNAGNVFHGIEEELLVQIFGIDRETARKLRGEDDKRGHIVRVEQGFQVISPPSRREEQERRFDNNGLEETVCSTKLIENINDPSRADIFNPQAGRFNTLTSYDLPILKSLKLSAERGVLYRNALVSPHYKLNAHSILYCTRGDAKIQITDQSGSCVFDEVVREGQMVVVPQNFVMVKQAGEQGFEWVAFRTNDVAMQGTLAGRTSALRGLPADVIAASYRVSREQAMRLKTNREETLMFESRSRSPRVAAA